MRIVLMSILSIIILTSGCMKDTTVDPFMPPDVSNGNWRISSFHSKGVEQADLFSEHRFEFQTGGKLVVIHPSGTQEGRWSEDKPALRLDISLGANDHGNQPLGRLTANWKLTKTSSTHLSAVNDHSSNYEKIEFTKN